MDASDAVRWGVNITLTDIPLTFLLGLSDVALAGFWSLVVISVIAEIHNPKYRYPVFAYALIASTVAIYMRMPEISGANLECKSFSARCFFSDDGDLLEESHYRKNGKR